MGGIQNVSILDSFEKKESEFNTHDEVLIIAATNSGRTFGQKPKCFNKVSEKFDDPGMNLPQKNSPQLGVLVNDGRGNSFCHKNRSLSDSCLTQENIIQVCEAYPEKLAPLTKINLFLFEEGGKYHFAVVYVIGGTLTVDYVDYEKGLTFFFNKKHRSFTKVIVVTK